MKEVLLTVADVWDMEPGEIPGLYSVCKIDDIGSYSCLPGPHEGTSYSSIDGSLEAIVLSVDGVIENTDGIMRVKVATLETVPGPLTFPVLLPPTYDISPNTERL